MTYADRAQRVGVLYRLPTAPQPGRTLEVSCPAASRFSVLAREDSGHVLWSIDSDSLEASAPPFAPQSFDRVVLHRTIEGLMAGNSVGCPDTIDQLLRTVAHVLAPGGLVVGCFQGRRTLSHGLRQRVLRGKCPQGGNVPSVARLRRAFESSGFVAPRLFSLIPDCEEPMRLVEADRAIARSVLRHEIRSMPVGPASYLFKRMLVETGLYWVLFARGIYFWAYRPC